MQPIVAVPWSTWRVIAIVMCSLIIFPGSNFAFCQTSPASLEQDEASALGPITPLRLPRLNSVHQELDLLIAESDRTENLVSVQQQLENLVSLQDPTGTVEDALNELDRATERIRVEARQRWSTAKTDREKEYAQRLTRLYFKLQRRIAIWQSTLLANQKASTSRPSSTFQLASRSTLKFDHVPDQWARYLELEKTNQVLNSPTASVESKQDASRRTLARLVSPVLTSSQVDFLSRTVDARSIGGLLHHAVERPDYEKLLVDLERFETRPTAYLASVVNHHYQNLLWSTSHVENDVALELDKFYRGPNIHLSASKQFINRVMPPLPPTRETVNDSILGANVTADNRIESRVEVDLIPDPNQIHFSIATLGDVDSVTMAERQGFQMHTVGKSQFRVQNGLVLGKNGVKVETPVATCESNQTLVGLESRFDNLPLFGNLIRKFALRKIRQETPKAEKVAEEKVAELAKRRVDEELRSQLENATSRFEKSIYNRLIDMDLDPVATHYSTTSNRIVLEHRLAGRDQLGAHTVRPGDRPGCLFDLQVHQSAINNLIGRLGMNGEKFTTEELIQHLRETLDLSSTKSQSLGEKKADFHFARFDPLLIEFKDDVVHISMNLASLRIGSGPRWKRVTLAAVYRPEIQGTTLRLNQDDTGTLIRGHRLNFRDRAAVGTIHKALFKQSMELEIVPEKFARQWQDLKIDVDRLQMRDGWAAISFADPILMASEPKPVR